MNTKAARPTRSRKPSTTHSSKKRGTNTPKPRQGGSRRRPHSTAVSWPRRQKERRTSSPSTWSTARSHPRRYRAPSRRSCSATRPMSTAASGGSSRCKRPSTSIRSSSSPSTRRRWSPAALARIATRRCSTSQSVRFRHRTLGDPRASPAGGAPAGGGERQKVWVVSPRFEVHDTLTIDPGLIDINIAYGYMCTADVLTDYPFPPPPSAAPRLGRRGESLLPTPPDTPTRDAPLFVDAPADPVQAGLADAIARCRLQCWELEHAVFGRRIGGEPFGARSEIAGLPNPDALAQVRVLSAARVAGVRAPAGRRQAARRRARLGRPVGAATLGAGRRVGPGATRGRGSPARPA